MRSRHFLFLFGIILGASFSALFVAQVFADTTSTSVTVNATVTGGGAVCGNGTVESGEQCDNGGSNGTCPAACSATCTTNSCGGPGGNSSPTISALVATAGMPNSSLAWTATDSDGTVTGCTASFGTTVSYGSSGTVSHTGNSYSATLATPTAATTYFFRIVCTDNNGATASQTGSLTTSVASDITLPVVSAVTVSSSDTVGEISWSATDNISVSSCGLTYGVQSGGTYDQVGTVVGTYEARLTSLLPSTAYMFRISCVDPSNNQGVSLGNFTTASDTTPPPAPSSFVATPGTEEVWLSWDYTSSLSDFHSYILRVASDACPATPTAGSALTTLSDISLHTYHDAPLTGGQPRFYSITARDSSGNMSATICASATPSVRPANCGNGILDAGEACDDGNANNHDACTNACAAAICGDGIVQTGIEQCDGADFSGASCVTLGFSSGVIDCTASCGFDTRQCINVIPVTQETQCTDRIDNDTDGFVDCADSDCRMDSVCLSTTVVTEQICNDRIDNDTDGAVDCADSDCAAQPACQVSGTACSDGLDNDADGQIDMADSGCTSAADTDEYTPPPVTIPESGHIGLDHLRFWIAERTISVLPADGRIHSLPADQLTVALDASALLKTATTVSFVLGGSIYPMTVAPDGWYYADALFPIVGSHDAVVTIAYTDGLTDVIPFIVESEPYGTVGDGATLLPQARVTLIASDGSLWDASLFRSTNPQTTETNGTYGFVVPNGTYRIRVEKQGYRTRETPGIVVTHNVIHDQISLLKLPQTVSESIVFTAKIAQEKVGDAVREFNQFADNPAVETVTQDVVAPTVVGVSFATVAPSLASIALPLLRFIFLQPLLLFGRRKREAWGMVYNSLTRLPVDLVVVRLIDAASGKIVQSRVTDTKGRYLFFVEPGNYKIEAYKQGFQFPSALLAGVSTDGHIPDVYHGEALAVDQEHVTVTPNIPLDPAQASEKTPRRIIWERWLRRVQHIVALTGIGTTLLALYISPSFLIVGFLILHIGLYILFIRFVKPKKPKGWGMVVDKETKAPVGQTIARLFSKKYDKLVATQVTDRGGRYSFLVGPNDYYVTYEQKGYTPRRSSDLILSDKTDEAIVIKENVDLEKVNQSPPPTTSEPTKPLTP